MLSQSSIAARKEAARIYRLPDAFLDGNYDPSLNVKALITSTGSHISNRVASDQKPQLYGRFGKFIDRVFDATFDKPTTNGVPRLVRVKNGRFAEATAKDRSTWHGLQICWSDTLFENMLRVVGPNEGNDDPSIIALKSLWNVRMHAIGNRREFTGALRGDAHNAATQSIRIALGMSDYAKENPNPVPELSRAVEIIDSPGPLISVAGLEMVQLESFASQYLGESTGDRLSFTIHKQAIRSDIYNRSANGRINLSCPIEYMPIGEDRVLSNLPMLLPGEQIGCPILLVPGAPQILWEGVASSMRDANLL